jgi:hypothetical protein
VITPTGGTAPYNITPAQTNLAAGNYTFTVTDANGCSTTVDVTITEPLSDYGHRHSNHATCNGAADGSVVITPTGGTLLTTSLLRRLIWLQATIPSPLPMPTDVQQLLM